ncbi:hypothetical protein [Latilactobacillus fuchuensis]|uniref:Uncharacterized protein n=1 Tax=Latilactobacillus fuchuensis TaxID=164393 RepID=A0A2N9DUY1_9LACO|nr:hypothetical protein [Latilactobacillus fuchuensis]SPC38268.1 membrane hypothetical protein [Latilactobacillus fuchuensis]
MAIFDWFMGTPQQSVLFLIIKIAICATIYLITITLSSVKNVNKDSLNQNNSHLGIPLRWLVLTVVCWIGSVLILIGNLDSLINPDHDSYLSGLLFFGTWIVLSLGWTIIAWSVLLINIKKSSKSATEKEVLYLNNNLTLNAGITGLMFGMVGVIMLTMVFGSPDKIAATSKTFEFHPLRIVGFILSFAIPLYLLVKIPKWFRQYVEKFI